MVSRFARKLLVCIIEWDTFSPVPIMSMLSCIVLRKRGGSVEHMLSSLLDL